MVDNAAPSPKGQEPVYVYLIASAGHTRGPVKIGISVDPRGRLRQHQTSCPHKLQVYAMQRVENARAFEQRAHRIFAGVRCSGGTEWFGISVPIAREVLRNMLMGKVVRPLVKDRPEDHDEVLARRKSAELRDIIAFKPAKRRRK